MLTVRGDSMIDAGILPGDVVLVEKGPRPKQNDVVVACVDGEWTLKYYVRDAAGVRLEPANRKYKFIRPQRSLEIGGVVRRHPQILSPGKSGDLGPNALPSWNRRIGRVGPTRRAVRPRAPTGLSRG